MASSSRIFIKNLPLKDFTEDDLKTHFKKFSAITDAKLIPNRRIAYIGYKSPEDAEKAVRYFNKTFIRMSKIMVEIARPIADAELPRPWSAYTPGSSAYDRKHTKPVEPTSPTNPLKRKLDEADAKDAKLQEYMEVMQPVSKAKIWSNGDLGTVDHDAVKVIQAEEGESDDEYVEITTKKNSSKEQSAAQVPEPTIDYAMTDAPAGNVNNEPDVPEDASAAPVTDDDWLRSKTSRLLDLEDNIEEHFARVTSIGQAPVRPAPRPVEVVAEDTTENIEETNPTVSEMEKTNQPAKASEEQKETDTVAEAITKSSRLFVRNLHYSTTEDELRELFSQFGEVLEAHITIDKEKKKSKGFAFILFESAVDAVKAYKILDGTIFQGRLLHIIAATEKRKYDFDISQLPLKKRMEVQSKRAAHTETSIWNSMYMNVDAVMSSVADRLGVSKSELLDPTSTDAAVKQAHAETHVIRETKGYLEENGVNLKAFEKRGHKDDKVILIKNFPYGTSREEITDMISEFGDIKRVLFPPAGTIAIVEFAQEPSGRAAFGALAYKKFKNSVLFLEKGPKELFIPGFEPKNLETVTSTVGTVGGPAAKAAKLSAQDLLRPAAVSEIDLSDTSTLFIGNLNFTTTSNDLTKAFSPIDGFLKATVKMKPDPKKPGAQLSMGFGFVEFRTKPQALAALGAMNGFTLEGHKLLVKSSHKGAEASSTQKKADHAKNAANKTKLIVKNLAFEASKKDIQRLLEPYGQLRTVRLPKKFGGPSRGFAFADFTTAKEAAQAMESLKDTHLLGRRLVIEYAAQDAASAEEEIERMQEKVGKQSQTMAAQTYRDANKRRKFDINAGQDEE
ncbi:hypothetical protein DFH27DRAFT_547203 [Peziza echinospora]|nr:hypothetical protein DFH27DRAFT_547203 [Peziza echinospora]